MLHAQLLSAAILLLVTCSACRPRAAQDIHSPSAAKVAPAANDGCNETWYPVELVHTAPYLWLELGPQGKSKAGWFLLDTGSNTSDVDLAWAGSLVAQAANGYVTAERFVFVYEQQQVTFHPIDLSRFVKIRGQEQQAGLLGTDFISEFSMELDLASARSGFVRQDDRSACTQHWAGLEEVELLHYDVAPRPDGPRNIPSVSARIDDVSFEAQLDTGTIPEFDVNTGSDIMESWIIGNEALLKAAGKDWSVSRTTQTKVTSGSFTASLYKRANGRPIRLSVGKQTYELDYVKIEPAAAGYPLTLDTPVAIIGMPILRQLTYLQIDPVDHKLRIKRK